MIPRLCHAAYVQAADLKRDMDHRLDRLVPDVQAPARNFTPTSLWQRDGFFDAKGRSNLKPYAAASVALLELHQKQQEEYDKELAEYEKKYGKVKKKPAG